MNLIIKSIFGSHLYGTDTPDSDTDYKGIFLPTSEECFLNKIPHSINFSTGENNSKNTRNDIDEEYFSLQNFMRLAVNGEMIVLDLLHTPDNMIIESSKVWKDLQMLRPHFYSKNLAGYLGYIRKQTAKYGVKGSRLAAIEFVLNVLKSSLEHDKMNLIWNELPQNEYCRFVDDPKEKRWQLYEVCGKRFQPTVTCGYVYKCLKRVYDSYGARAEQAKKNEGIDWKAISHAFRAGLQLEEIYTTTNLKYPLKDAEFIRDVKLGKFHYVNDNIQEQLEELLLRVEQAGKESSFPQKIDVKKLETFILEQY